jgi:hypothetical protein
MRPLGHEEAKTGREEAIAPIDPALFALWERWRKEYAAMPYSERYLSEADFSRPDARIRELMAPLHCTQTQLDLFILHTPITDRSASEALGLLAGAGYASLPGDTLTYGLPTPKLNAFGYRLHKNLIVTGELGVYAGHEMRGTLVNRGTIDFLCGERMIGTLVNHGKMGKFAGTKMIGSMMNHGTMEEFACQEMIGSFVNNGDFLCTMSGAHGPMSMLNGVGRFEDNGTVIWKDFRGYPDFFLYDIKNPGNLEYDALRAELLATYRRYR